MLEKVWTPKEWGKRDAKGKIGNTKKMDNPKNRTKKDENTARRIALKGERPKLNITSLADYPLQPRHETPPNTSNQHMQGLIVHACISPTLRDTQLLSCRPHESRLWSATIRSGYFTKVSEEAGRHYPTFRKILQPTARIHRPLLHLHPVRPE